MEDLNNLTREHQLSELYLEFDALMAQMQSLQHWQYIKSLEAIRSKVASFIEGRSMQQGLPQL